MGWNERMKKAYAGFQHNPQRTPHCKAMVVIGRKGRRASRKRPALGVRKPGPADTKATNNRTSSQHRARKRPAPEGENRDRRRTLPRKCSVWNSNTTPQPPDM